MYYRRKILLNLLSRCGGEIEKLKLQKLLLIFCSQQKKPAYHFVPYKYGCFSFQANADLCAMYKTGLVKASETTWSLKNDCSLKETILPEDAGRLERVCSSYAKMDTPELIKHTYVAYPFYALNSTIVRQLLNKGQQAAVANAIKRDESAGLFTIGYEGKSLEGFLNTLLRANIKTLCDVRKNAYSMKYGFSKTTLSNACENVGIKYLHMPAVGIDSSERKGLKTPADYSGLFAKYKTGVLLRTKPEQNRILDLIHSEKRVALMCYEAAPSMCHRSYLAESILSSGTAGLPLVHL